MRRLSTGARRTEGFATRACLGTYTGTVPTVQCCGSGMFIPDRDFYPFRIADLGSRTPDPKKTEEEGEKVVVFPFFSAQISQKLKLFYF